VALTLDFSRPEDYSDGFKTLSRLQYLQERILPLSARFKTSTSTVSELQELNKLFCENEYYEKPRFVLLSNSLKSYNTKFHGHLVSIEALKSRVQGVLELVRLSSFYLPSY
jgi:hypothetical protein